MMSASPSKAAACTKVRHVLTGTCGTVQAASSARASVARCYANVLNVPDWSAQGYEDHHTFSIF